MRRIHAWQLALCASLLVLSVAWAAGAEEICRDDDCIEECRESRRVCHAAAHRAHRVCHEACAEGDEGCRLECRAAFRRARAVCAHERLECRLACRDDLDPACLEECTDALGGCREELSLCRGDCEASAREALRRCRELEDQDSEGLRVCIASARREAHACARDCRTELACGAGFRECLDGCALEP
jgi:hypothetical protein